MVSPSAFFSPTFISTGLLAIGVAACVCVRAFFFKSGVTSEFKTVKVKTLHKRRRAGEHKKEWNENP